MKIKIGFVGSYISEQIRDEIESLKLSNPKHPVLNIKASKERIGDYSDILDGLICKNCYVTCMGLVMYDIIYPNTLKTKNNDTQIILDFLSSKFDIHFVFVNKIFFKDNMCYELYARHADDRYSGIDLTKYV